VSHRSFLISIVITLLLFPASARSQETAAESSPQETSAKATEQKALKLLESVAGQVDTLRSAENRARIGSNVAELLWNHDEERARSLFAAAGDDIRTGLNNTDPDESGRARTFPVFSQLRRDIIERIARHDPDLALEFLRSTRPPIDLQPRYDTQYVERAIELQLAGQIAAKNPQLALKLGRELLAEGFSPDLLSILTKLAQKDKDAALDFYKAVVDKLKSTNLARDQAALVVALNLVRARPALDEQTYRDLIGLLLTSALSNGCAASDNWSPLCRGVGSVFSQIEKYDAARAVGLRQWAGEEQNADEQQLWAQDRKILDNGTVEEILALVPKHPSMQSYIYTAAVLKARSSGDFARARQMASTLPDEDQRRYLLGELNRSEMWTAVNAEKLAAFQRDLSNLHSNEERMQSLLYVASEIGKNDRKTALRLLDQAGQIIDSIKAGKEQLAGQMSLAMLYCSLKSDRGFAIMESVIPKLNELVAAAATLDRFENTYLRDGEWAMSAEGNIGSLLTALATNAGYFAWYDFDRSVNLASQFERPELRLMAQLKIGQAIMAGTRNSGSVQPSPVGVQ
jgi:hypothetical protein